MVHNVRNVPPHLIPEAPGAKKILEPPKPVTIASQVTPPLGVNVVPRLMPKPAMPVTVPAPFPQTSAFGGMKPPMAPHPPPVNSSTLMYWALQWELYNYVLRTQGGGAAANFLANMQSGGMQPPHPVGPSAMPVTMSPYTAAPLHVPVTGPIQNGGHKVPQSSPQPPHPVPQSRHTAAQGGLLAIVSQQDKEQRTKATSPINVTAATNGAHDADTSTSVSARSSFELPPWERRRHPTPVSVPRTPEPSIQPPPAITPPPPREPTPEAAADAWKNETRKVQAAEDRLGVVENVLKLIDNHTEESESERPIRGLYTHQGFKPPSNITLTSRPSERQGPLYLRRPQVGGPGYGPDQTMNLRLDSQESLEQSYAGARRANADPAADGSLLTYAGALRGNPTDPLFQDGTNQLGAPQRTPTNSGDMDPLELLKNLQIKDSPGFKAMYQYFS
jgi:hypothetical protein